MWREENLFFHEIFRGVNKKAFKVCTIIGSILCILNAMQSFTAKDPLNEYLNSYISTPIDEFILFNLSPLSNLFILILPLIASIAYSDTYFEDIRSGFVKLVCTRYSKRRYLIIKFAVNFIIAGITYVVPLILNIIVLLLRHPNISENPILGKLTIYPTALFSEMFYKNPWAYIGMWILIYFIYAGAFASVALAVSIFIKNKFIIVAFPFILCQTMALFLSIIDKYEYYPLSFLYVSIRQNINIILGVFFVIFISSAIVFFIGGERREIY